MFNKKDFFYKKLYHVVYFLHMINDHVIAMYTLKLQHVHGILLSVLSLCTLIPVRGHEPNQYLLYDKGLHFGYFVGTSLMFLFHL